MSEDKLRDGRKRGFYIIDNDLIDKHGQQIGAYGIAVYNLIARYADGNGENAFPSYQTIAEKLGISRPKAVTTINQLVELGLVKKEKRTDQAGDMTSNIYTLVDLGGGKPHLPPSKPHLPPSKQDLPGVVNDVNQGGKPRLPDQDTNNKTHNEQEGNKGKSEKTEQPETVLPPSLPSNSQTGDPYMDAALKRQQERQQNGGRHKANRINLWPDIDKAVPADVRLPLVERLIDMHGLRAAIDIVRDDSKLADMHKLAADLYVMGFKTLAEIEAVYERFKEEWKGKTPAGRQLISIASAMQQTNQAEQTTPTKPPPQLLTLKQWCLKTYHTDNPKFADVPEAKIYEQYNQYRSQQQQTH